MFYSRIPENKLPERREQDFPIYGNAVWFMAAMLQTDYLLEHTHHRDQRIAILANDLRRTWSLFVENAIATDFEDRLERAVAEGKQPSGSQITELYLTVLRDYYGKTTVRVPPIDGAEWMTLSNAYYGHIRDEWAFAMAAAAAMAENVTRNDPATLAALESPIAHQGSYLSADLLRDAGADPTVPATYEAVYRRMNADMDQLDAELAGHASR
jgi:oligoendopeptidase F